MRPTALLELISTDDRMFVLELSLATTQRWAPGAQEQKQWTVVTRRNIIGYPVHRVDTFPTQEEAIKYYKKVVVQTPRRSLNEKAPDPLPTLKEYQSWLREQGYFDPILNPDER